MFQTNFYGTVSLPLCRILCFKLTTELPKEQAQRWSFCIIVFFMSTTFYEISRKSAKRPGAVSCLRHTAPGLLFWTVLFRRKYRLIR